MSAPRSARQDTVARFTAGFADRDAGAIGACLHDDVVVAFNGAVVIEGREAFVAQVRADMASGRAETAIEQFVEQGDVVVAVNSGRFVPDAGEPIAFASVDVVTFRGDRIARVSTVQAMPG